MVNLKPQDVYLLLKLSVRPGHWTYATLASEVRMSASEVHASVRRAADCRLSDSILNVPRKSALLEFLEHGLRYVFPPDLGAQTRGMPTSFAAEPLRSIIALPASDVPVWPDPKGKVRGYSFSPLFESAPAASLADPKFYEVLALADALRDGQAREREIAVRELRSRLTSTMP